MKVSILVHSVSENNFARAYVLAKVIRRFCEVEILGPAGEGGIWEPCDTGEFVVKTTEIRGYPQFLWSAYDILRNISGNVVYALKPRPSSYGIGLVNRIVHHKPVVLDIDDWETGLIKDRQGHIRFLSGLCNPESFVYVWLMEHLVDCADEITVVSDFLRNLFHRGIKVPHGRDTDWLNPAKYDGRQTRERLGLTDEIVVMWLGTPRQHKGLDDLAAAVRLLRDRKLRLVIVGAKSSHPVVQNVRNIAGDRVLCVGPRPFAELPWFLAAADLVAIVQRESLATLGQVPAKLFDAMAMAKPIISTRVSDIPKILDGCGIVVEAGKVDQISSAMEQLIENPELAHQLGAAAREKCVREYSFDAMEKALRSVFEAFM